MKISIKPRSYGKMHNHCKTLVHALDEHGEVIVVCDAPDNIKQRLLTDFEISVIYKPITRLDDFGNEVVIKDSYLFSRSSMV